MQNSIEWVKVTPKVVNVTLKTNAVQDIEDAERFIDALSLDPDQVRWALAQAVSRAYGDSPRLIPALDCVNHSCNSMTPIVCVPEASPEYRYQYFLFSRNVG